LEYTRRIGEVRKALWLVAAGALVVVGLAQAETITINIGPGDVPDEAAPLVYGEAPTTGLGPDSWQNADVGKVNWHARYLADGDFLSALFPDDAATLTLDDIASISYWTKRPDGTLASEDWAVFIYTRPMVGGDSSWYGHRFLNDYGTHTETDTWTEYSTDTGMQFRRTSGTTSGLMSYGDLQGTYGSEYIEMISVQTMSNYVDFNGYMDGLTITLDNGNVGIVNFGADAAPVPEPASMALLGMGIVGVVATRVRKKRNTG
jgi:PEP-CTERM motif